MGLSTMEHLAGDLSERDSRIAELEASVRRLDAELARLTSLLAERRHAEESVRESEERFRVIAARSPDVLLHQDLDLRYVWVANLPPELTEDQVLGHTDFDLYPTEQAIRMTSIKKRVIAKGLGLRVEVPLTFAGIPRYYDVTLEPWKGSDGEVKGLLVYARNITEQKRAESALRESEARFRAVFNRAAIGIALVDENARVIESNPALQNILGYSGEELRSIDPAAVTYPEDLALGMGHHLELMAGQRDFYQMEERYIRKDGTMVWARLTASAVPNPSGKPRFGIYMVEDITAGKKAEESQQRLLDEVKHRARELETIIEAMADSVVIYGRDGEIVRLNATAERLLGYGPEENRLTLPERMVRLQVETTDGQAIPLDELPPLRALRGETVRGHLSVAHHRGRAIWVSTSAAPFWADDGTVAGAVMTITDVTRLHSLQQQRSRYILGISHGLRTPLTVVHGQAQLLQRTIEKAEAKGQIARSAEAIVRSSHKMSVMLRDLVDLTEIEAGQILKLNPIPVDLRAFGAEMKRRLAGVLRTERVRVEGPADLPRVLADPDRLERIFANLLDNALRYSSPGSDVTVSLSVGDGEVVVAVSDRGDGISADLMPLLFQPYLRRKVTSVHQESLGLGLYITKGLVEAHGGRIWAESRQGEGSTFTFTFPLA